MKLLSLTCNQCGAPLEVPEGAKFITCTHCSTRLVVQQSGGAAYTETLEAIGQRTEKIADDVETLKLQGELDRLDREWMLEREQYMVRDQHGGRRLPRRAAAGIVTAIVVGFAVLWMFMAQEAAAVLFGLLFIAAAVVVFCINLQKADRYERRLRQYESRRRRILSEMESRLP
jgi:LSD1 subclass zinc finger protein